MICALVQDDIVVVCPVYHGFMHKFFGKPFPKVGNNSSGIFCHEMRALINPWVEPKIEVDLSISTPHKVWEMVK